jgi:hypothetical protein
VIALKVLLKKALIAFAVICLVTFAFTYPELLGDLLGRMFDGMVGAVEAVVRLLAEVARG